MQGESSGLVDTGASTGIGACSARHIAGRGFRVFGTVRRAEDAGALERVGVTALRMDVTDTGSIARARAEVERALAGAPLLGLVNNAGIPAAGPLELLPLDELRRVLEVNVVGAVAVTQAVLPQPLDRVSLWIPDRLFDWLIYRFLWKQRVTPPAPASGAGDDSAR